VCFACLGTSLQLDGSSRLVLSWGLRATRGSVAAAAPASRCRATCWLLPCRALPWGLHGDLLGRGQRRGRLLGCGRPGRLAVGAVGGVRRAGAGRWACASRSGARSALLLPPGDPELPAPQCCRLAPWDRSLLHRVAPSQVSAPARVGAVRLERLKARSPTLVGRPCRLAWSVARRDRRLARGIAAGPATVKPGQPSGRRSDRCRRCRRAPLAPSWVGRPRGSACQERDGGHQDPDAGAPQRPAGLPVGPAGPPVGLGEGPLLALHLPVVVQQVGLAGAVPAVAGIEAPGGCACSISMMSSSAGMPRWRWLDPANGHDRPGWAAAPLAASSTPMVRHSSVVAFGLWLRVVNRRAFNGREPLFRRRRGPSPAGTLLKMLGQVRTVGTVALAAPASERRD
jgi:hypothetical protein